MEFISSCLSTFSPPTTRASSFRTRQASPQVLMVSLNLRKVSQSHKSNYAKKNPHQCNLERVVNASHVSFCQFLKVLLLSKHRYLY